MGFFKKIQVQKKETFNLSEEDKQILSKLQTDAYMKEAREIVVRMGEYQAKRDLVIPKEKEKW